MIAPEFVKLGSVYLARFERIANVYRQLGLAPKDSELSELLLVDYLEQEAIVTRETLRLIGVIAIIFLILIATLVVGMRSLSATVKKRTKVSEALI